MLKCAVYFIQSDRQTMLPRDTDNKGSKKVSVPTNQSAVPAG